MKVPEPRKLPSGNYYIQMQLNGVSVSVTRPTAKECKDAATLIKAEHRAKKRVIVKPCDYTVEQAIEKYCNDKKNVLSPSTLRGYNTIKNNRFQSVMKKKIAEVSSWQRVINEELNDKSAKTVKNSWGLLSSAMRYVGAEVPKVDLKKVQENDLPWLTPEQVKVFIKECKGDKCEIAALLMLHSLRRSEVLNLKWDNIDLKNNTIFVSGSAVYDENNQLVHKDENKNVKSQRTIKISIPGLISALNAVEDKTGYVVPYAPNVVYKHINAVCERAKLPKVGCHGLRRSFASLAYHLKWSERHTMEAGGWSNPQTMHKFYIKLSQQERNADDNKMQKFFA